MHRFAVGTTLSSIFNLPEEKLNISFRPVRLEDIKRMDRVVVRDSPGEIHLYEILMNPVATEVMAPDKFNAMPASETKWLVVLVKVEQHLDGSNEIVMAQAFEGVWLPNECETIRDMADRKGKPIEGFNVWLPIKMREQTPEEIAANPPSAKVQEAMKRQGIDPSRLEKRLIQVLDDPHYLWLKDVACR